MLISARGRNIFECSLKNKTILFHNFHNIHNKTSYIFFVFSVLACLNNPFWISSSLKTTYNNLKLNATNFSIFILTTFNLKLTFLNDFQLNRNIIKKEIISNLNFSSLGRLATGGAIVTTELRLWAVDLKRPSWLAQTSQSTIKNIFFFIIVVLLSAINNIFF